MIFEGNEKLNSILVENTSEETIKNRLLELIGKKSAKPEAENDKGNINSNLDLELEVPARKVEDDDVMTSPVDSYLMDAKKKRAKAKLMAGKAGDAEEEPSLEKNISHCDIGMSPEMQKLAPLEQRIGYQDD